MKKALVIIDLQSKHDDYSEEYIELINSTAIAYRENGDPVVWTRFVGSDWDTELFGKPAPMPGEPEFEIFHSFNVQPEDKVFDKLGYSSFSNEEFEGYLKSQGVDVLTLVGRSTGVCVLATAYDALHRGFKIQVIKDGLIPGSIEKNDEGLKLLLAYAAREINIK